VNTKDKKSCPANIKLVGFDIDGVFTDGRFYLSNDGIESKAFHTQDGFGIRQLLDAGIAVAVISGRQSAAVEQRMAELGIAFVIQGCRDKVAAFDNVIEELAIDTSMTVFVGDDVPDLALLRHAGYAIAVANAVPAVRDSCDMTTTASGGAGAVREVCELILAASARP
jgi:3-deoxy-D-manno-octulosonate 8-phosphate phosphatase (KDO 8-P phosphatase)